ncbi:hypothetical protein FISHEDRAFT_78451 [Fistulina hepatica ATCC 64428]|nr:hypothetical protein FISHEDRAFT_78451 [Fistulina hepatica ATCC 64428]
MPVATTFRPRAMLPLDPFFDSDAAHSRVVSHAHLSSIPLRRDVILLIGEPTLADVRPVITAPSLSRSLVILATHYPPAELFTQEDIDIQPSIAILHLSRPLALDSGSWYLFSLFERADKIARIWRVQDTECGVQYYREKGPGGDLVSAPWPHDRTATVCSPLSDRSIFFSPSPLSSTGSASPSPKSSRPASFISIARSSRSPSIVSASDSISSSLTFDMSDARSSRSSISFYQRNLLFRKFKRPQPVSGHSASSRQRSDGNEKSPNRAFDAVIHFVSGRAPEKQAFKATLLVATASQSFLSTPALFGESTGQQTAGPNPDAQHLAHSLRNSTKSHRRHSIIGFSAPERDGSDADIYMQQQPAPPTTAAHVIHVLSHRHCYSQQVGVSSPLGTSSSSHSTRLRSSSRRSIPTSKLVRSIESCLLTFTAGSPHCAIVPYIVSKEFLGLTLGGGDSNACVVEALLAGMLDPPSSSTPTLNMHVTSSESSGSLGRLVDRYGARGAWVDKIKVQGLHGLVVRKESVHSVAVSRVPPSIEMADTPVIAEETQSRATPTTEILVSPADDDSYAKVAPATPVCTSMDMPTVDRDIALSVATVTSPDPLFVRRSILQFYPSHQLTRYQDLHPGGTRRTASRDDRTVQWRASGGPVRTNSGTRPTARADHMRRRSRSPYPVVGQIPARKQFEGNQEQRSPSQLPTSPHTDDDDLHPPSNGPECATYFSLNGPSLPVPPQEVGKPTTAVVHQQSVSPHSLGDNKWEFKDVSSSEKTASSDEGRSSTSDEKVVMKIAAPHGEKRRYSRLLFWRKVV